MNRVEQLKKFLEEDPNDPFNLYALALEYQKTDRTLALRLFKQLTHEHPDYLATYYPMAKLYADLDDRGSACKAYEAGIEKSRQQQNMKALRELQAAYDELRFE